MQFLKSKVGWRLSVVYVLISVFLILSQGLFGESFIAIILGLPWTLVLARFEFFGSSSLSLYAITLAPIVLNAVLLYVIGLLIERKKTTLVFVVILFLLLGGSLYWYSVFSSIDHSQYILPESESAN